MGDKFVQGKKNRIGISDTASGKISGRFVNGGVVLRSLERRFDSLSSIGSFKEPSYPSPASGTE